MKLLMEPLLVAAILMKELPDKQVGSAESAKDASAARRARPRCFAPFFAACPALRRRLRTAVALSGLSSSSVLRTLKLVCGESTAAQGLGALFRNLNRRLWHCRAKSSFRLTAVSR